MGKLHLFGVWFPLLKDFLSWRFWLIFQTFSDVCAIFLMTPPCCALFLYPFLLLICFLQLTLLNLRLYCSFFWPVPCDTSVSCFKESFIQIRTYCSHLLNLILFFEGHNEMLCIMLVTESHHCIFTLYGNKSISTLKNVLLCFIKENQ